MSAPATGGPDPAGPHPAGSDLTGPDTAGPDTGPGQESTLKQDTTAGLDAERFVRLSVALTGFDAAELAETGLAEVYRALVARQLGPRRYGELIGALDRAGGDADGPAGLPVHELLTGDEALGDLARAVCHLWYLGTWPGLPGEDGPPVPSPVSAHAYAGALVWRSFGGHAPGTGRPGYGSWSLPPAGATGGGR
ncbi:hypothetical protein POF50_031125 [Streptomyces sp. SL13]|uniref:Uncharacterized protein n=1 Tax=Streptantibioticus silvisoli TaxID=2705255 RepID=A0AA90H9I9_9ACTN|nr:hypothetical protein [Streptantibioticus silvisoli]MDI5973741.1 hypothetical protein [Streptantibioticus silvisoli]